MADAAPYQYIVKFVIIGDSGVGKSNLMLRLTDDRYMVQPFQRTRILAQIAELRPRTAMMSRSEWNLVRV